MVAAQKPALDPAGLPWISSERIIILVGPFGSGKTEIALNLALRSALVRKVALVDLDIVTPYFRTRDQKENLEREGINVITPEARVAQADLPSLPPELERVLGAEEGQVIIDVGGDAIGARVLGSLRRFLVNRPHTLLFVVNTFRPFTSTPEKVVAELKRIEETAQLKVTGLVANNHFGRRTTWDLIEKGWALAQKVGQALSLPVVMVTYPDFLLEGGGEPLAGAPLFPLTLFMQPP